MPKNAGAAFGMASGYFGATSPSTLAVHAIILLLLGSVVGFINGFIGNAAASNVFSFIADIFNNLGLVILVIAAARFVADAFRSRP